MTRKRQANNREQPGLFPAAVPTAYGLSQEPLTVRAHRHDPATSHEAAKRVSRSERAALHRKITQAIVQAHPGHTGMELWGLATEDQRRELGDFHELYRKMSDLRHQGLLTQGPSRPCRVRGSNMVTWLPVETS